VVKEYEDYSIKGTVILKSSPSTKIKNREELLKSTEDLRQSMEKKLDILGKWLRESEEILPRPKR
jgi:hypothetical protein